MDDNFEIRNAGPDGADDRWAVSEENRYFMEQMKLDEDIQPLPLNPEFSVQVSAEQVYGNR